MREPVQIPADEIRECLDEESLRDWVQQQRWYASKSRHVAGIEIVESVTLRDAPFLFLALVQTRFATGTHELYQLPLSLIRTEVAVDDPIARTNDWTAYDALTEPVRLLELVLRMDTEDEIEASEGRFTFHRADGVASVSDDSTVRLMGVEQSNSSIVIDDQLVLKVFRKLEPGINPELEMLRFLTHREFPNIAPLHGWYDYDGSSLAATLGVAQQFLPDAVGGWELALDKIEHDPDWFLDQLYDLGHVTAELHNVLASDCRRSGVLAGGAEPGGAVAAHSDGRRGHRADLRPPARRRTRRADHRPRPGRPRAPRRSLPDRRRRPHDPHARRLPPRPDPPHAARLGDHRLRGRARPRAP